MTCLGFEGTPAFRFPPISKYSIFSPAAASSHVAPADFLGTMCAPIWGPAGCSSTLELGGRGRGEVAWQLLRGRFASGGLERPVWLQGFIPSAGGRGVWGKG